jgi:hypothetical protein
VDAHVCIRVLCKERLHDLGEAQIVEAGYLEIEDHDLVAMLL